MNLHRADQLRDAISRCEISAEVLSAISRNAIPPTRGRWCGLEGDYVRARDALAWMRNRLESSAIATMPLGQPPSRTLQ